jgi:hypothetical protein
MRITSDLAPPSQQCRSSASFIRNISPRKLAVSYRLGALAKLLREGEGKPWTFATQDKLHMVNEALFRAAARAPLFEAKTVGEVSFERNAFMKIAVEESEADGTA